MVKTTSRTTEKIQSDIRAVEKHRETLFKQREPIDDAIEKSWNKLNALKEELALTLDLTDIKAIFKADGDTAYKARAAWAEARGMRFSGVFAKTQEPALQISLNQNENTEKTKKAILEALPLYTPIRDFVMFAILEATLSEHGVYYLHVKPDASAAKITKTTYSRDSDVFSGSLDDTLNFIAKKLYYKGLNEED